MTNIDLSKYNNFEAMQEELGQATVSDGSNWLTTIKINSDFIDGNETIRPGWFYYDEQVEGNKVRWFFPDFVFRPFVNAFQYRRFSKDDKNKRNNSIIIKNMREEALDEKGGLRCGKLTRKELDALPPAEAERLNKDVNLYRVVMGLAAFKGLNEKGETRDFTDVRCQLELRGTNFMPIGDTFTTITKNKTLLYNHLIKVSNIRKKNGAVVFYEFKYDVDLSKSVPFAVQDIEVLTYFNDLIKRTNKPIVEKYNAVLKAKGAFHDRKSVIDPDLNDPLDDIMAAG